MRFRLPQTLVYWPPAGSDSFGRPTLGTPVEYKCRWEDTITETIDSNGDIALSSATVYLTSPVAIGGVMWLGTLATGPQSSGWIDEVKANSGTHEIINILVVPSLSASQKLTKVMLK